MHGNVALALLLALLAAMSPLANTYVADQRGPGREETRIAEGVSCNPGTVFTDGCEVCLCGNDGSFFGCTRVGAC